MAKKDLSSLMNGILGDGKQSETPKVTESETPAASIPKRRKGRPQKPSDCGEIRASIIVDQDVMRKIKYISLVTGSQIKDVIDIAFRNYLESWEKENGNIKIPNI